MGIQVTTTPKIVDHKYELILDEKGNGSVITEVLNGELKAIKFKRPSDDIAPVNVRIVMDGLVIFDERIEGNEYYVLKVQPRDGFNQFWSMSNEFYVLNDVLFIEASGIRDTSIYCTFRMEE